MTNVVLRVGSKLGFQYNISVGKFASSLRITQRCEDYKDRRRSARLGDVAQQGVEVI